MLQHFREEWLLGGTPAVYAHGIGQDRAAARKRGNPVGRENYSDRIARTFRDFPFFPQDPHRPVFRLPKDRVCDLPTRSHRKDP
jgi:hypothetical protein